MKPPHSLLQAFYLVVSGTILGVLSDLVLPHGILAERDTVLRDLELQIPVYLWPADEALAGIRSGELVPLDGRDTGAFQEGHLADALHASEQVLEERLETLAETVAGRDVVVIMNAQDLEAARTLAQRVGTDLGARRVGTVAGGFAALLAQGAALEGQQP